MAVASKYLRAHRLRLRTQLNLFRFESQTVDVDPCAGVSEHVVVTRRGLLGGDYQGTDYDFDDRRDNASAQISTPARDIIRRVCGVIQFRLDTREETDVTMKGGSSLVFLRGYIESVTDRGMTVPGAVRTSPTKSAELGLPRPLDIPLICADAHVESNQTPKHAPQMKRDAIKKLEALAPNVGMWPPPP